MQTIHNTTGPVAAAILFIAATFAAPAVADTFPEIEENTPFTVSIPRTDVAPVNYIRQDGMRILLNIRENQALSIDSITCDADKASANLLIDADGLGYFPTGVTHIDALNIDWLRIVPGTNYTLHVNRDGSGAKAGYHLSAPLSYRVVQVVSVVTPNDNVEYSLTLPAEIQGKECLIYWGDEGQGSRSHVYKTRGKMVDRHYEKHSSGRYWMDREECADDGILEHDYADAGLHVVTILVPDDPVAQLP